MATNSYKSIESSGTKAEEPAVAYQQAVYTLTDSEQKLIMRAEQDRKAGRIYTQAQVDKIVDGINDSPTKESFEERYRKAREFAYKHFDKEFIQYLEARNFLVDEPFPLQSYTDKEWEKELERAGKRNWNGQKKQETLRMKKSLKCMLYGKTSCMGKKNLKKTE